MAQPLFSVRMRADLITHGDNLRVATLNATSPGRDVDHPNAAWCKRAAKAALTISITNPDALDALQQGAEYDIIIKPVQEE